MNFHRFGVFQSTINIVLFDVKIASPLAIFEDIFRWFLLIQPRSDLKASLFLAGSPRCTCLVPFRGLVFRSPDPGLQSPIELYTVLPAGFCGIQYSTGRQEDWVVWETSNKKQSVQGPVQVQDKMLWGQNREWKTWRFINKKETRWGKGQAFCLILVLTENNSEQYLRTCNPQKRKLEIEFLFLSFSNYNLVWVNE